MVTCQSDISISEKRIQQLESENGRYEREQKSCEKQINVLRLKSRQLETEKRKCQKDIPETEENLQLASRRLNALKR